MKPVKEILRSPRFMREVSLVLFFFAGLSFLVGALLFSAVNSSEVMVSAVGSVIQAIVYFVLAIMIRRGSMIALWIAGVLFVLDTAFLVFQPSGKGLGLAIVSRGILIYVLIRYVQRERALECALLLGSYFLERKSLIVPRILSASGALGSSTIYLVNSSAARLYCFLRQ